MPRTKFPWPKPTSLSPSLASLKPDDYERHADVIEWFVRERGACKLDEGKPLARWCEQLRSLSKGKPLKRFGPLDGLEAGSIGSAESLAAATDALSAILAAHSIELLEGTGLDGPSVEVAQSFVREELAELDSKELGVATLPGSVTTLQVAAQAALLGGERVAIYGKGSRGLDVEWFGRERHERLRFECKRRAFSASFRAGTTPQDVLRWCTSTISGSGRKTPPSGALRERSRADGLASYDVLVLGGVMPRGCLEALGRREFNTAIEHGLDNAIRGRRNPTNELPHAVVAFWTGVDTPGPVSNRHYCNVPAARPSASRKAQAAFARFSGE